MNYDKKLANYPLNTIVLITDPDHDRLTVTQIESAENIKHLEAAGIDYMKLSENRILTIFSANQAFLLLIDFRLRQLKKMRLWFEHSRFMIKTTASSTSWDEWAHHNGVKVINVPVGFKEIANIMIKVESKLKYKPEEEVIIHDVFANPINLGVEPRLLFAGEESGGMIMGPPKLINGEPKHVAIAMREKSATEAIFVASALAGKLEEDGTSLSQCFLDVLEVNNITAKFDTRADISYYNESEPDIDKLNEAKKEGEKKRTKNDLFYLAIALALKCKIITLEQSKDILNDTFKELDFSNLESIKFVGDGTYLKFDDKFVEIRPSGTDAKTKAYAAGLDKKELKKYTKIIGEYSGKRTDLYKELIPKDFYEEAKENAMVTYQKFVEKDKD